MVRDQVFISYSHQDRRFLDELQTHLKPYLRQGTIMAWSDQQIAPGSKWFDKIRGALVRTSVAVLLVSPDFLASDFIHEHELGPLLKEAEAGGVRILWILIRDCSWKETPLKDYQGVESPPGKPLALMTKAKRDTSWRRICEAIRQAATTSETAAARNTADPCYMAGAEETGKYVVVFHSPKGRIGYRDLEGSFRIRIEPQPAGRVPLDALLTRALGWKQPGDQGQDRYSLVVQAERFPEVLRYAIRALNPGERGTAVCPSAPEWVKQIVREESRKPADDQVSTRVPNGP
jgi:hypothetical protein